MNHAPDEEGVSAVIPVFDVTMSRSSKAHIRSSASVSLTAWWALLTMSRTTMRSSSQPLALTNTALPSVAARS